MALPGKKLDVWSACCNGDARMVSNLLKRNRGRASHQTLALTVNTVSPWTGWTPLMCAAANGHLAATHAVLEAGPDVNVALPGSLMTALHLAAQNGHGDVVRLLLTCGADPFCVNSDEHTSLAMACEQDRLDAIRAHFEFDDSKDHTMVTRALGDLIGTFSDSVERILKKHVDRKDAIWKAKADEMRAAW